MAKKKKVVKKAAKKTAKKTTKKTSKVATKKSSAKKSSEKKEFHRPDYRTDITEAELIQGLDEELQDAWVKLREYAASLGEQRIYASGWAIMFAKKNCYLFVRPKKKFLETCIFLPRQIDSPDVKSARAVSKTKYANVISIIHPDQVEEPLTDWVREAFDEMPAE